MFIDVTFQRRHRKRLRERSKQEQEKAEQIESLHKVIDGKMAAAAQEILQRKKAMEVRAAADSTLSEVRRKIQSSKAMDLMNG